MAGVTDAAQAVPATGGDTPTGAGNGVPGLAQALHGFTKHLKPPTAFQPESRAEELSKWLDWRFQMTRNLCLFCSFPFHLSFRHLLCT